jgi:hypothetical protein
VRVSLVKGRAWSLGSGFPVRMSLEGEPGHWGDPSEGEPSKRESLVTGERLPSEGEPSKRESLVTGVARCRHT